MYKNKSNFTKDYFEIIVSAAHLAKNKNFPYIDAESLFFAIFKFLEKFKFNIFFWKFINIENINFLENYYQENYDNDIDNNIPKYIYFDLDNRFHETNSTEINNIELKAIIVNQLNNLSEEGYNNFDFISLLYLAIKNSNEPLKQLFEENLINLSQIEKKLTYLIKNENIQKLGAIQLFQILSKIIEQLNLEIKDIEFVINIKDIDQELLNMNPGPDVYDGNFDSTKIGSNTKQEEKKLTIEYFGMELTKETKDGYIDPVIGREREINQVIYTLLRKNKNNPLLLGEAGVGKTAIIEGLAQKIVSGKIVDKLKNKKIFVLDMGTLLAGTKYRGEFEARLKTILEEATDPTNNIILFIDEIHTIIGAGNAEGSADAANMLKPLLSRGKIQLIGATTYNEYQKHIEKDPALKRRFQEIFVNEPTYDDTVQIIHGIKSKYEEYHGVVISPEAIIGAVEYSRRYLLNKFLPDKAIDLIDESCARKSTLIEKLKNQNEYLQLDQDFENIKKSIELAIEKQDYFMAAELKEKEEQIKQKIKLVKNQNILPLHLRPVVEINDIGQVLSEKLGIPAEKITSGEIQKLKKLEGDIKSKIFGQEEAVENVVNALKRNRLSMIARNKPIATFLFLGPSGVGKTFLAKLLAEEFFGDEKHLIRVDMSEFMEKYSVSKLIGSAPGYIGYDEGGILTEAVRRKPYSVILFDEIEKASPEIINILLGICDEGYLKDNKGRFIDFKNTIIILTSNIGSEEFGKKILNIGFSTNTGSKKENADFEIQKERVLEEIKEYLSPEILNRLDKILVFKPLDKNILNKIFTNKLNELLDKWKDKPQIILPTFSTDKIKKIINKLYDPQYGARPIEKHIFEEIEIELINQVLK